MFAAVGGACRNGAASPECVRVEGNARYISRNPFLHFSPFPPCSIPRSIHRDSGDSVVHWRSRRRRSCLLAVFGGTGQFRCRRRGGIVGVVMPVRRHALVLRIDLGGVPRFVLMRIGSNLCLQSVRVRILRVILKTK